MRVYLLPDSFRENAPLVLEGKERNYIVNVLRLREGQHITGRDKNARPWDLVITKIEPVSCTLSATGTTHAQETTDLLPQQGPSVPIILYQCMPKGRKMDDIVRMATEAGVLGIIPVLSRNCVSGIGEKANSRFARYNAVIKEAIQQSGSMIPTYAGPIIDIASVPRHFEKICLSLGTEGRGLFFHQRSIGENQKTLPDILFSFRGAVALVVGAEGGLTDDETGLLLKGGFTPVLLKTNILRCETAAIYAVSAVQTLIETGC